ncbi:NAD(P)(+) transhydrogenase (Re/Si-specific) subunit beta [Chiayiivirga flava]|uniref:NAD(P) transhydrogenase subunit beta n=1 Tax=Chiayiivirga flava TaxID=659595 RepID=A0A7W8FY88_9GAMM|nr:NAD(P)(+) transhydrogenase (Re/Si-specific) subunit beta [Chiayiivirga flava]MBB5207142.1 NAD(P) transhydrogenase subunit beta [Chiayiivirga flava]
MDAALVYIAKAAYFVAAVLFILGIKRMASPVTARKGIQQAGLGMVIAVVATFGITRLDNIGWILAALAVGIIPAWLRARSVQMTAMPQQVALYNGMGGGSAAAIGAVELLHFAHIGMMPNRIVLAAAVIGALIGSISLTGSVIAWGKLDGVFDKRFNFKGQQAFNLILFVAAAVCGALLFLDINVWLIVAFFVLALVFGVAMTLPIGGADMPVVISLFNAFTGLAVAFEGFVLGNEALIIAGMVVGAAGMLLTQLMAKAMNRPITGVLFSQFGGGGAGSQEIAGSMKPIEPSDAASLLYMADKIVIVPGYGMAVAQAQHKIWELSKQLIARDKEVKFAIHPVAGRMPGHMNVLLAEAGVPYDLIVDMEDINPEFGTTDVAIVIGANDVVNPVAKTDKTSPIYGMPILDVINARQVIVIKRGKGTGFAGIENALFYADNCRMLYADGQEAANKLSSELKAIDSSGGH